MNIEQIISRNRICLMEASCTKDKAIDVLINKLYEDNIINNKQEFQRDIELREQEYCTYIGHETSIPHAISNSVNQAGIAFLKSDTGFVYGSQEERVRLMFMLAIPQNSNEIHLRMLSMLAKELMHQNFRDALLQASSKEAVFALLCNIH